MSLILEIGDHLLINLALIHHRTDIFRTAWSPGEHLRCTSPVQFEFIQEREEESPDNAMNKVKFYSLALDSPDGSIVEPLLPLQPLDSPRLQIFLRRLHLSHSFEGHFLWLESHQDVTQSP